MEALVHLVNGETYRFRQDALPESHGIIQASDPSKVFEQPALLIHGTSGVTGFNTEDVEFLEFFTSIEPEWKWWAGIESIDFIKREQMASILKEEKEAIAELRKGVKPGEPITGYGDLTLRSTRKVYLQYKSFAAQRIQQLNVQRRFFDMRGIYLRMGQNHHGILNTAKIVRWTFYPGPAAAPMEAWQASRAG